ncbi:MAG: segregation/condensation protein A, partial [Planctomycetes bacterium]|nr:segregation/condensation protein A [Planctomycetota bacterium]
TEEYLRHVEILKMLDIDLAGDFLVMAATLMEIKSAMLLPRPEAEEDAADVAIAYCYYRPLKCDYFISCPVDTIRNSGWCYFFAGL